MTVLQPHPDDLRVAARLAAYPNSEVEREALANLDNAVFDRVRTHEQNLVANALASRHETQIDETAAAEATDMLRNEIRYALDRPTAELDMTALAARYVVLRSMAEKAAGELARAEARERHLSAKLQDPYKDLMDLYSRWPLVRPVLT